MIGGRQQALEPLQRHHVTISQHALFLSRHREGGPQLDKAIHVRGVLKADLVTDVQTLSERRRQ